MISGSVEVGLDGLSGIRDANTRQLGLQALMFGASADDLEGLLAQTRDIYSVEVRVPELSRLDLDIQILVARATRVRVWFFSPANLTVHVIHKRRYARFVLESVFSRPPNVS